MFKHNNINFSLHANSCDNGMRGIDITAAKKNYYLAVRDSRVNIYTVLPGAPLIE